MARKPTNRETARKPNMREAILAAAEELFATYYSLVTPDRVARRGRGAGCGRAGAAAGQ